jgi:putative oxidoreductase
MLDARFPWSSDLGKLILRVALGILFIPHGLPKLKNPAGFTGLLTQLHVPAPTFFAWLVALLEVVGAAMLIVGLLTRLVGLGLAVEMLVAILAVKIGMAHAPFTSTRQTPGWEFEFLLLATGLGLAFLGSGRYGIDAALGRRRTATAGMAATP